MFSGSIARFSASSMTSHSHLSTGSAEEVRLAAQSIRSRIGSRRPTVAIVLGSGLGSLTDRIADPIRIAYRDIPGFHAPAVEGHKGELVVGTLGGKTVVGQSGRFHMYEGHSAHTAALPVRAFASLGVRTLVVTNAAGGVNPSFGAGTIMVIKDHLNLTGQNPLLGPAREGESRFPDMSAAYDPELRAAARHAAAAQSIPVEEGVYAGLLGPNYETPAEIRMLQHLGADAVGMSTVVEIIAARTLALRCLGISIITNPGAGLSNTPLSHAEVMQSAAQAGTKVARLIEATLASL